MSIISRDNNMIPYRKELRTIGGSVTATILLQQLIYWDSKMGGREFYKFIMPPKNINKYKKQYRVGESWTEELGFSEKEFHTAIKKLKVKNIVESSTNLDRITTFKLNRKIVEKLINEVYPPKLHNCHTGVTDNCHTGVIGNCHTEVTDNCHTEVTSIAETTTETTQREILRYLNSLLKTNYKCSKHLKKLLEEGYNKEQIESVIKKKYEDWFDTEREQFLRPSTLFGEKFEEYLNAKSKERRIKENIFLKNLITNIENVKDYMTFNFLDKEALPRLKGSEKTPIFKPVEIELLGFFSSMKQVFSLLEQGELEPELRGKLIYVSF